MTKLKDYRIRCSCLHASTWVITVPFALLGVFILLVGDYRGSGAWRCEHGWPLAFVERGLADDGSVFLSLWTWDGRVERFHPWALALDVAVIVLGVVVLAALLEWRRRRRRSVWQISLRDALALMLLVGVVSAWLGSAYRSSLRQSRIVEKIQEQNAPSVDVGGWVAVGVDWDVRSDWLFELLGMTSDNRPLWWADVSELTVSSTAPDTDRLMKQVQELSSLKFLYLEHINMTDAAFRRLSRLKELESLVLCNVGMSDKHMRHLAALKNLRFLDVSSNGVSDKGLAHLHALKRLETLDIVNNGITDEGVEALWRAIPGLQVSDD